MDNLSGRIDLVTARKVVRATRCVGPVCRKQARMHCIELLDEAIVLAKRLGYHVRQEWIGSGGGMCEVRGKRWLFIDLSQSVWEQLETVRAVLDKEPELHKLSVSPQMVELLHVRRAA